MAKDSSRRSAAASIDGPWLKPQAVRALPNANRDFDLSRDPFIRQQVLDMEREAAGGSGSGRGSRMVRSSQPHPAPKPSHAIRRGPDAASFSDRWLAERRDAAFAQAAPNQSQPTRDRQPNRTRFAPSR